MKLTIKEREEILALANHAISIIENKIEPEIAAIKVELSKL